MTAKILTQNGQVLQRSMYRLLTQDELAKTDGSDAQDYFIARVYENLESFVLPKELQDIGLENIPQYDLYDDET